MSNMKKLISIFMLLFAASLLFADMESEKKQILSLFKSYEYVGTTAKNGGEEIEYTVFDYNDAKGTLYFKL